MKRIIPFLIGIFWLGLAQAEFWPEAALNESVPSLEAVVGHDHGEKISSPAQLDAYIRALASAAPDRTRLVQYATSWEGRPLSYLVISSEANIARLDTIKAGMQQLADPRNLDSSAASLLVRTLPAVVWLSYGVHGNEISSGDAALVLARHLLASGNPMFQRILEDAIVVIDPAQNPDGRARFVHHYEQHQGIEPAPSSIAAERREAWPNGRTNHYLFDMNRDWFALTQPETQGRIAALLEYYPLVHVDVHEMSTDSTYYFPPAAMPFNPHITDSQKSGLDTVGKVIANTFDRFGFDYFTREVFDALYPGYGDSWPAFHGSLGMTFEMASARGLAGARSDGTVLTYKDGVHRQFVATVGTLNGTVENRRALLNNFLEFRRTAAEDRRVYGFALDRNDPALVHQLAGKLTAQGVEVSVAAEQVRICNEAMPAGSVLVAAAQPAGRLVRTLLDEESPMAEAFLEEQERRRAKGLEVELYDILGWSFPALYGLEVTSCDGTIRGAIDSWQGTPAQTLPNESSLAWLVPWDSRASAEFLTKALRRDVVLHTSTNSFTQANREYPDGTLIIKVRENREDILETLQTLAAETGAEVIATNSSWSDKGSNFGSSNVRRVRPPKIALAWDEPTNSNSTGAMRHVIERQLGYPVTPVRTSDLGRPALDGFDVLILPNGGNYGDALGESGTERLERWVSEGGTLIGVAGAVRYLSATDMLPTKRERAVVETAESDEQEDSAMIEGTIIADQDQYESAIEPLKAAPDRIPGVLMRAAVDPDHWLGAGTRGTVNFMVTGRDVYDPLDLDEGTNVARFESADELLAGGHLWEENRQQWAFKPAVMVRSVGRGQVIGLVGDPAFRGYMNGLDVLTVNAVFRGPAYTNRSFAY